MTLGIFGFFFLCFNMFLTTGMIYVMVFPWWSFLWFPPLFWPTGWHKSLVQGAKSLASLRLLNWPRLAVWEQDAAVQLMMRALEPPVPSVSQLHWAPVQQQALLAIALFWKFGALEFCCKNNDGATTFFGYSCNILWHHFGIFLEVNFLATKNIGWHFQYVPGKPSWTVGSWVPLASYPSALQLLFVTRFRPAAFLGQAGQLWPIRL